MLTTSMMMTFLETYAIRLEIIWLLCSYITSTSFYQSTFCEFLHFFYLCLSEGLVTVMPGVILHAQPWHVTNFSLDIGALKTNYSESRLPIVGLIPSNTLNSNYIFPFFALLGPKIIPCMLYVLLPKLLTSKEVSFHSFLAFPAPCVLNPYRFVPSKWMPSRICYIPAKPFPEHLKLLICESIHPITQTFYVCLFFYHESSIITKHHKCSSLIFPTLPRDNSSSSFCIIPITSCPTVTSIWIVFQLPLGIIEHIPRAVEHWSQYCSQTFLSTRWIPGTKPILL